MFLKRAWRVFGRFPPLFAERRHLPQDSSRREASRRRPLAAGGL